MIRFYLSTLLAAMLAILLAAGCDPASEAAPDESAEGPVLKVRTAPVQAMDLRDTLTFYGSVAFRQESFLASQFEGRLSEFSLLTGDRVRKGEQIALIIPPGREALLQSGAQMTAEVQTLAAAQVKAVALRSPIDGTVLAVRHQNGDVLAPGEAIVHIGDRQTLQIFGDVPAKYLAAAKRVERVQVTFPNTDLPEISLPVAAVAAQVDPSKQTASMRLDLPNPGGKYYPGMLVNLSLPSEVHSGVPVVDRRALVESEGTLFVFVVKDHRVEKRPVVPGIMQNRWIEIRSGVSIGEAVVTDRAYSLEDGLEVEVDEEGVTNS